MKALICSSCGATKWKEDNKYRTCLYCGTKFLKAADVEQRTTDISSKRRTEKPGESVIALNDDVERLLQKCRTDTKNARKYANLILDIDPTNIEALQYLR